MSLFHKYFSNILLVKTKPTTWFIIKWKIGQKWVKQWLNCKKQLGLKNDFSSYFNEAPASGNIK